MGDDIVDVVHRIATLKIIPAGAFMRLERIGESFTLEHWPGSIPGSIEFTSRGKIRLTNEEVHWLLGVLPQIMRPV